MRPRRLRRHLIPLGAVLLVVGCGGGGGTGSPGGTNAGAPSGGGSGGTCNPDAPGGTPVQTQTMNDDIAGVFTIGAADLDLDGFNNEQVGVVDTGNGYAAYVDLDPIGPRGFTDPFPLPAGPTGWAPEDSTVMLRPLEFGPTMVEVRVYTLDSDGTATGNDEYTAFLTLDGCSLVPYFERSTPAGSPEPPLVTDCPEGLVEMAPLVNPDGSTVIFGGTITPLVHDPATGTFSKGTSRIIDDGDPCFGF